MPIEVQPNRGMVKRKMIEEVYTDEKGRKHRLTLKQKKFVDGYVRGDYKSITALAVAAGYSPENRNAAHVNGLRALQSDTVQQAIAKKRAKATDLATQTHRTAKKFADMLATALDSGKFENLDPAQLAVISSQLTKNALELKAKYGTDEAQRQRENEEAAEAYGKTLDYGVRLSLRVARRFGVKMAQMFELAIRERAKLYGERQ